MLKLRIVNFLLVLNIWVPYVTTNPSPIIGGAMIDGIDVKNYPFIVSIQQIDNSLKHICGGVLISTDWILTAAHCFDNIIIENLSIVVGEEMLTSPNEKRFNVKRVEMFDYVPYSGRNDIALFQINANLKTLDYKMKPFDLTYIKDIQPDQNIPCEILGYGSTYYAGPLSNNLQKANVKLITNDECAKILGSIMAPKNGANSVCAIGVDNDKQDSCQGDSGGPLICSYNNSKYLYGIISHGLRCGGIPSIYTVINNYLDQIYDIIINVNNI